MGNIPEAGSFGSRPLFDGESLIPENRELGIAGRQPGGDSGTGESVCDTQVKIQLQVRKGIRLDYQPGSRPGRDNPYQVGIGTDQFQKAGQVV